MNVEDLIKIFKNVKDESLDYNIQVINRVINAIADYVMYEQTIVKKDNISSSESTITYRYDAMSYGLICYFIEKITFIREPIVGGNKTVIIEGLPEELKDKEKELSDKIFILDKIKDSFMHLVDNKTMFEIDPITEEVILKNVSDVYSLECKVLYKNLLEFNYVIKKEYFKLNPDFERLFNEFDIIKDFKEIGALFTKIDGVRVYNCGRRQIFYKPEVGVLLVTETGFDSETLDHKTSSITINEIIAYYTYSYLTLLNASKDEKNFPIINSIYKLDFSCKHPAYTSKMQAMITRVKEKYEKLCRDMKYLSEEQVRERVLKILFNDSNGKETGLLVDISQLNNLVIKNYMRNARAHANNRAVRESSAVNEIIKYYDVANNSEASVNPDDEFFSIIASRTEFNELFDEINNGSEPTKDTFKKVKESTNNGDFGLLESLLNQLENIISFAGREGYDSVKELFNSNEFVTDFIDLIRKSLNGTLKIEDTMEKIKSI